MEKVIHQTWKNKELSNSQLELISSVKNVFCDYEYKFWTDEDNENLIVKNYPEFHKFYKTLLPVEKSDFVRHLYIHQYGGIYLDIDVKMNKLPVLENADMFLCDQTKEANIDNFGIIIDPFFLAGNKGYPFFYDICKSIASGVIYKMLSTVITKKYFDTLYKTGPYIVSKFYLLNKDKYNIQILIDVFTTLNYESNVPKENFYGIHYQLKTWFKL